jgi:hypothetical protein
MSTMKLLDDYLRAVKMYMPRRQDDIINELSENLRSQMEERERELGRTLTEVEQEAILNAHGSPMIVAGRYGATGRSVSFGYQFIGPELFPLYVRVLLVAFSIAAVVTVVVARFVPSRPLTPGVFLFPWALQFVVITVIFSLVDFFGRRSRQQWSFPPAYLQPLPRWQSAAGFAFFAVVGVWWAMVPYYPSLLLAGAAAILDLAPGWQAFYWPTLLLFLISVVQRSINWVHPEWNWLQPATRLVTNGLGMVMIHFALQTGPFVTAASAATDLPDVDRLARGVNGAIWWTLASGLSVYLFANCVFCAYLMVQQARYWRRQRHPRRATTVPVR